MLRWQTFVERSEGDHWQRDNESKWEALRDVLVQMSQVKTRVSDQFSYWSVRYSHEIPNVLTSSCNWSRWGHIWLSQYLSTHESLCPISRFWHHYSYRSKYQRTEGVLRPVLAYGMESSARIFRYYLPRLETINISNNSAQVVKYNKIKLNLNYVYKKKEYGPLFFYLEGLLVIMWLFILSFMYFILLYLKCFNQII